METEQHSRRFAGAIADFSTNPPHPASLHSLLVPPHCGHAAFQQHPPGIAIRHDGRLDTIFASDACAYHPAAIARAILSRHQDRQCYRPNADLHSEPGPELSCALICIPQARHTLRCLTSRHYRASPPTARPHRPRCLSHSRIKSPPVQPCRLGTDTCLAGGTVSIDVSGASHTHHLPRSSPRLAGPRFDLRRRRLLCFCLGPLLCRESLRSTWQRSVTKITRLYIFMLLMMADFFIFLSSRIRGQPMPTRGFLSPLASGQQRLRPDRSIWPCRLSSAAFPLLRTDGDVRRKPG
jgi:hypothetical protein